MSKRKAHKKHHRKSAEPPRTYGPSDAAPNRYKEHRQDAARRETRLAQQQLEEMATGEREREEYLAGLQAKTYERLHADDSKHRPARADPLTTGAARATGMTAKAVKRSKAMTRYEYDQATGGGQ